MVTNVVDEHIENEGIDKEDLKFFINRMKLDIWHGRAGSTTTTTGDHKMECGSIAYCNWVQVVDGSKWRCDIRPDGVMQVILDNVDMNHEGCDSKRLSGYCVAQGNDVWSSPKMVYPPINTIK